MNLVSGWIGPAGCRFITLLALGLGCLFGGTDVVAAKSRFFQVRELTGTVWTRGPNHARWQRSWEGQLLTEGQLIQVTRGAAVTLIEATPNKLAQELGERIQIRFTQPLIARISPDMLRSVRVSTYFVEDRGGLVADSMKIVDVKMALSDAWQRLTAVATGRIARVSKTTLVDLAKDGVALGSAARKLTMLAPVTNAVVESREWPVDIKVVWRHPEKQRLKYLVYCWPAGSPRGGPVGTTDRDFFTVQVLKAGVYLTQITSGDGSWQSPAHVVHAIVPQKSLSAKVKGGTVYSHTKTEILRASYPPDNTTLIRGNEHSGVVFVWEADSLRSSDAIVLNILAANGQLIHEEQSRANQVTVPLAPGRYRWYISTNQGGSRSTQRSLVITGREALSGNLSKTELFRNLLDEKRNATLVLSDGL
jgi:hypothetical protein